VLSVDELSKWVLTELVLKDTSKLYAKTL